MSSGDPRTLLRNRITGLDSIVDPSGPIADDVDGLWEHVIWEMSAYTNTAYGRGPEELVIETDAADGIVAQSALLAQLDSLQPGVVRAPLDRLRQEWTAAASWHEETVPTRPSSEHFQEPAEHSEWRLPSAGFYTSTALTSSRRSMWRLYLDQVSTLYRYPWYRWHMPVPTEARLAEIDSALRWVEFVESHHRRVDGLLYVDWQSAALEFDGIHLCLAAVVAVQSFSFRSGAGLTAPVYWDVEQTLWSRWRFGVPKFVDRTDVG